MKHRIYASLSLVDLLQRIVARDEQALAEFHDHRRIYHIGEERLLFIPCVMRLLGQEEAHGWSRIETDTALTIILNSYVSLPEKDGGADCSKKYEAALAALESCPEQNLLLRGLALERILNCFLRKDVHRALREARRNGNRTRYTWRVDGGVIRVLLPRTLTGSERAQWLSRNVPFPHANRVGERDRVQGIIDARLGNSMVSIDQLPIPDVQGSLPWSALDRVSEDGIAESVADEKAANCVEQRPRIAALGPERVRALVLASFDAATDENVTAKEVARSFGLDTATYSRFAGRLKPGSPPADLWRNLAQLLAATPRFREACEQAGVWGAVDAVVTRGGNR